MQITAQGLDLIKQFEGLRLKAYADPVGIPTIGYGHTAGVKMGDIITAAQADEFLRLDVATFEDAVAKLVTVPVNPNQFSALVSFAFNLGSGALAESTLLRKLNAGDYPRAAAEFSRWVHAGDQVLPGLVARRQAEADLFLSGVPAPVAAEVGWRVFAPPERWQEHLDGVGEEARKALSWVAKELGLAYTEDATSRKIFVGLARAVESTVVPQKARPVIVPQIQHTPVSCGQCSVAMCLTAMGAGAWDDTRVNRLHGFGLLDALRTEDPCHDWRDLGNLDEETWTDRVAPVLHAGYPVIVGLNGPKFSPSGRGHIVTLVSVDQDVVKFADPATGGWRLATVLQILDAPPHPDGKFVLAPTPI